MHECLAGVHVLSHTESNKHSGVLVIMLALASESVSYCKETSEVSVHKEFEIKELTVVDRVAQSILRGRLQ